MPAGKVYLVGAGPGGVAYLTLRAYELLSQAQALIYDALVDSDLLQLVSANCIQVDVGKRGGKPSSLQTDINSLLVQYCQQGFQVVRLKSGDPFIFGRSVAEIDALRAAGCDFEVVPGLSAALAAPLLARIPLTDPVLSRCFVVISAHEPDMLNWEALSQLETMVILMGSRYLAEITTYLMRHGRSPDTPIAVIRWAGHPQQQVWEGTLATILQRTAQQSLSPAVIVIGEVVRLRPFLSSSPRSDFSPHSSNVLPSIVTPLLTSSTMSDHPPSSQPLAGLTVLVTRAVGQASEFTGLLKAQGAEVVELAALEIGAPSSWAALDQAIAELPSYDWLILTSTNGVEYFFARLATHAQDARALAGIKIAVVGKKTATALQQRGILADFVPPDFVADALVEHFPERDRLPDLNILFPRVESGGRDVLVNELRAKGARVTEVPAYQSGCAQKLSEPARSALQQGRIDIVTFASSKTVECFHQLISTVSTEAPMSVAGIEETSQPAIALTHLCFASIGPQTSATCLRLFGRVDIEAKEYTLEGLIHALVAWATTRK